MVKETAPKGSHSSGEPEPLHSDYRDDDAMRPIIRLFLMELPDRRQTLAALRQAGDMVAFRRLVHQIKGAGGGYGYPSISLAAAQLERCLEAGGLAGIDQCDVPFQALLKMIDRAHAGLADLPE